MWQRYRTLWISIAAGWMLIALSFTFNYYFYSRHYVEIFSTPPGFAQMLIWEIPYWVLWAAMAPVVFRLARRFPLEPGRWAKNALLHVPAGLGLAIAHRVVYLPICWLLYVDAYQKSPTLVDLYRSDLFFNLPTGLMSYGTFLLVGNVMDYFERYEAGRLRESLLTKPEVWPRRSVLERIIDAESQGVDVQMLSDEPEAVVEPEAMPEPEAAEVPEPVVQEPAAALPSEP